MLKYCSYRYLRDFYVRMSHGSLRQLSHRFNVSVVGADRGNALIRIKGWGGLFLFGERQTRTLLLLIVHLLTGG